ncbi:MAG: hypothetical protein HZT40_04180 [Candidatus Thiothrix singaporensis]|uniref:Uncharacterized protein n=1 Tax=Candidatus Thiothrix singaporensis TaxID=2799669 RepID=A0A7L6AME8_9GAMM|nr:MAG: hypothetical protein HZT40_04180 [Candidatus Thiothrix singaporensis]
MQYQNKKGCQNGCIKNVQRFCQGSTPSPQRDKRETHKSIFLLTSDPRHPSLQVKKIKGAKRNDVYECRIDKSWRMVMRDIGQMQYDLIAIGEHDKTINLGKSVLDDSAAITSGLAALGGGSIAGGGGGMAAGQSIVNTISQPLGASGSIGCWAQYLDYGDDQRNFRRSYPIRK